jgi:hypothetical protein
MRDRIKKILKEEDFDWIKQQNPIPKREIITHLNSFQDYGYYARENDKFVETLHQLALTKEDFIKIAHSLDKVFVSVHSRGVDEGSQASWYEGYREGRHEREYELEDDMADLRDRISELRDESDRVFDERYEEGYDEGKEDGYKKGFSEGGEAMYHKAFEEGRAYESGKDTEYYERGESGFSWGDDEEMD